MKKMILLILLLLLLCGCAQEQPGETTLPAQTQPTQAVEPTGIYDPDSAVEAETAGAVRSYPLDMEMVYHMEPMGQSLLVFSGSEGTTLTVFSGENLYIEAQLTLSFWLRGGASTQVSDRGISYEDPNTREMVLLDTNLKESRRFAVPEGMVGDPRISADRRYLYYCTSDAVRVMDLETGINRLLKQISYPVQTLEGLLLEEKVLQCGVGDSAGSWELLFIDTQTGQTLERTRKNMTVVSSGENWYASIGEGAIRALVYGAGAECRQILPGDLFAAGCYLPRGNALVTISGDEDVTLDSFNLETGSRTASLKVEGFSSPWCVAEDGEGFVWMLAAHSETGEISIHRWDRSKSAVTDELLYSGHRYTQKDQDTQALALCREQAQAMSEKYGIEILIGAEAVRVQPWNYDLEEEYCAPVIRWYLNELDEVLGWYPADFFTKTAEGTDSGLLKVCIVRSLTGTPESGSLSSATGTQFWEEKEAYLVVAVAEDFQRNFCHELCHAMETRVYAESNLFDDWDWLCPEGFEYDFDYIANATRDGSAYLQADTRGFIDTYSMSFPKEDRARIMEYAMMEGNAEYFTSEIMQNKLKTLSQAIREAFGWKKSEEVFRWEQYLNEPIAYQKKK